MRYFRAKTTILQYVLSSLIILLTAQDPTRRIKVNAPKFDGFYNTNDYLDYEPKIEDFFNGTR